MTCAQDPRLDRFFTGICGEIRIRRPGPGLKASILQSIDKHPLPKMSASTKENGHFPPPVFSCRLWPAASLAATVLIFGIVFAAFPDFAEAVKSYIMKFTLGRRTHIMQISPTPEDAHKKKISLRISQNGKKVEVLRGEDVPPPEDRLKTWTLNTPAGSFGGNVPEGAAPGLITYNTLASARQILPGLRYPAWLPPQYNFQKAIIAPSKDVFIFFSGPGENILLHQSGGKKSAFASGTTEQIIDRLKLRGETDAVWIAGEHNLIWERANISYLLCGGTLDKKNAVKIAESVQ